MTGNKCISYLFELMVQYMLRFLVFYLYDGPHEPLLPRVPGQVQGGLALLVLGVQEVGPLLVPSVLTRSQDVGDQAVVPVQDGRVQDGVAGLLVPGVQDGLGVGAEKAEGGLKVPVVHELDEVVACTFIHFLIMSD